MNARATSSFRKSRFVIMNAKDNSRMSRQQDTQDTDKITASQTGSAPKGATRSQRRKRQRQRNESAREFLAWMPPLRHWPRNPESFKPEDSEIFRWMLENPRIVEALHGLEGAKRYNALAPDAGLRQSQKGGSLQQGDSTDSRGRTLPSIR
jgi:hypothetical protein